MVREIRIYFEGHPSLREGLHEFLKDVREDARSRRCRFELVAGRGQVVRDFMRFLADRRALDEFYGHGFRTQALPANPQVEQVNKDDVLNGLKAATRVTQKGAYSKTLHAPKLLRRLDAARVTEAAPNCRRLFKNLRERIADGV